MPVWEVSKASSHSSSQALTTPPASFPATKAPVPLGRLQSSNTTPRSNPTPTHSPSSPTTITSNVGKREALSFTDEKHWIPSNILSSSVGDGGGGDCETQSLNQWDIDTADSQPMSLGGHRFVSACWFLQFKTKTSYISILFHIDLFPVYVSLHSCLLHWFYFLHAFVPLELDETCSLN